MTARDLARLLRAMADAGVAELERMDAEARAERRDWHDQQGSPLGRRHNAIVRDRLARGAAGAAIVNRRHLLSQEALAEELGRLNAPAPRAADVGAELRAQLRLVGKARR